MRERDSTLAQRFALLARERAAKSQTQSSAGCEGGAALGELPLAQHSFYLLSAIEIALLLSPEATLQSPSERKALEASLLRVLGSVPADHVLFTLPRLYLLHLLRLFDVAGPVAA